MSQVNDHYAPHSSIRVRQRRSNASLIMRRLEEVSLHPVPPSDDPPGLPSYEQAIARNGPHDAPPPPYPGYVHVCAFVAVHDAVLCWVFCCCCF